MYRNCKFGTFCRFNHSIDDLKDTEEIEMIKKQLDKVEKEILERDEKIAELNKCLQERVDSLEKSNAEMKRQLEEVLAENLKMKTLMVSKSDGDKIVEAENKEMEKGIENDNQEANDCGTTEENRCEKCDFIGKNKAGVKIHITAKHKEKPLMQRFSLKVV